MSNMQIQSYLKLSCVVFYSLSGNNHQDLEFNVYLGHYVIVVFLEVVT